MVDTTARLALAARLEGSRTQEWLAGVLKVGQSAVSRWVNGTARPAAHLRVAIELLLQIPAPDWMTPEEVELLEKVREIAEAEGAKAA